MFVLSLIVFFVYEYNSGSGMRYELQWTWLENVGFLKKDGITFFLGVDGIAAPLVLLNGIVIFAAVFVSWNIQLPDEGLLRPAVPAGRGRLRRLHLAKTCSSSSSGTRWRCCRCTC